MPKPRADMLLTWMQLIDVYRQMWGYRILETADEAVARFRDGWAALGAALATTTDKMLESDYEDYPRKKGFAAISALLNEVAHQGTQICVLRDLYHQMARGPAV